MVARVAMTYLHKCTIFKHINSFVFFWSNPPAATATVAVTYVYATCSVDRITCSRRLQCLSDNANICSRMSQRCTAYSLYREYSVRIECVDLSLIDEGVGYHIYLKPSWAYIPFILSRLWFLVEPRAKYSCLVGSSGYISCKLRRKTFFQTNTWAKLMRRCVMGKCIRTHTVQCTVYALT